VVPSTEWRTAVGSVDVLEGLGKESARAVFGRTRAGRYDRCRDVGRRYSGSFARHRRKCFGQSGTRMDYEVIERDSQAVELILVGRPRTIHVELMRHTIRFFALFSTITRKMWPKSDKIKRNIYLTSWHGPRRRNGNITAGVHGKHVRRQHMRVKNARELRNV